MDEEEKRRKIDLINLIKEKNNRQKGKVMKEEHGKEIVEKSKGKEIRFNIETDSIERVGNENTKREYKGEFRKEIENIK